MGNKKNRIQKKNKKLRKNKKPSVRNIMPYSTAKRVVLSIQRLICLLYTSPSPRDFG